ncbi:unnamed protein product [Ixodes persulcatus]
MLTTALPLSYVPKVLVSDPLPCRRLLYHGQIREVCECEGAIPFSPFLPLRPPCGALQ